MSRLFLTQRVINAGFGAAVGAGLAAIGVPTPFVWGVLAGILKIRAVRRAYSGPILPLALALSIGSGWSMAFWTIGLFVVLEGVTGQVIEPIFEGRSTGLTPIAIIIAATFWAWLWGPVGLVIATPLTVVLVALGRHVEALKFFDVLLGDEPALSELQVFYHRMLSNDPLAVVEHAKVFMAQHLLSHYCDLVARPALALAHRDVERGFLGVEQLETFRASVEGLFADIVHEFRALKRDVRGGKGAQPQSLPFVHPDELIGAWRTKAPLVVVGTTPTSMAPPPPRWRWLQAPMASRRGSWCQARCRPRTSPSSISPMRRWSVFRISIARTPARIQYAARRAKSKAPDAKVMLGLWTATNSVLETVRAEVGADFAVNTLHDAATIILAEASGGKSVRDETRTS